MGWREAAGVAPKSDWRSVAGVAPKQKELIDPLDGEVAAEPHSLDALKPDTTAGAVLRGATQGVTLGFGDEGMAVADTIAENVKRQGQNIGILKKDAVDADPAVNPNSPAITKSFGPTQKAGNKPIAPETTEERAKPSLVDVYRNARDSYRADNKKAEEASPVAYGLSEFGGNMAVPIPGGAVKGLVPKILANTAKGAAFAGVTAAGNSEADLSKGEGGRFVDDVSHGAKWGGAAGGVSGVLEYGGGKLGERFAKNAKDVDTQLRADKISENLKSAVGSHGHDIQDTNRNLENLRTALADPASSPQLKADIKEFMGTQGYKDLVEQAGRNSLDASPLKFARNAASKQAIRDAPAMANKEIDEYLAQSTLKEDVLPRVMHYAKPAVAAILGGMAAGPVGAGGGAVIAAAAGKPGRAVSNLIKNKRFQIGAWNAFESGAETAPEIAGKLGIVEGERQGEKESQVEKEISDYDPIYQEKLEKLKQRFNKQHRNSAKEQR